MPAKITLRPLAGITGVCFRARTLATHPVPEMWLVSAGQATPRASQPRLDSGKKRFFPRFARTCNLQAPLHHRHDSRHVQLTSSNGLRHASTLSLPLSKPFAPFATAFAMASTGVNVRCIPSLAGSAWRQCLPGAPHQQPDRTWH